MQLNSCYTYYCKVKVLKATLIKMSMFVFLSISKFIVLIVDN